MKKKKRLRFAFIFLSAAPLLLMWAGLYFCFQGTGFSVDKISSNLAYDEDWEVASLPREKSDFLQHEVFPQTFYYLSAGNQCYAFISEDRKYVLKFFKMQNLQVEASGGKYSSSLLEKVGLLKSANEHLSFERVFTSYKYAFDELAEETGLIFVHLNKSRYLKSKVNLIDQRGKKYQVDLDATEFVVQFKAEKIFDCLNALVRDEQWMEAKQLVHAFFHIIAERAKKGFSDQSLGIRNNFGFVANKAIQLDCGTLTRDDSMKYPFNFRNEIMHIAERMNEWAQSSAPEMSLMIQEEAQAVINDSF